MLKDALLGRRLGCAVSSCSKYRLSSGAGTGSLQFHLSQKCMLREITATITEGTYSSEKESKLLSNASGVGGGWCQTRMPVCLGKGQKRVVIDSSPDRWRSERVAVESCALSHFLGKELRNGTLPNGEELQPGFFTLHKKKGGRGGIRMYIRQYNEGLGL